MFHTKAMQIFEYSEMKSLYQMHEIVSPRLTYKGFIATIFSV